MRAFKRETDFVSVIIPIFNGEEWLGRCINSVVKQTYQSLEIILVDDGSTDGSAQICKYYESKDERIRYIRKDNAGSGAARNTGMKAASSGYVTFLDADDWLEPTFVEKIIIAMLKSGSDIGQCDIWYVDFATMFRQEIKLRYDKPIVSVKNDRSIVNKSRLFAWGKIFRKELLERSDFSFPEIVYEDTVIPLLIIHSNRIYYVAEPLINYFRGRTQSLSNSPQNIQYVSDGLKLLYDRLQRQGLYDKYVLEYKKIALGQLRFCCRKWGLMEDDDIANGLSKLEEYIVSIFPNLEGLSKKKYFALGDNLLLSALDNVIPYKHQVADSISTADEVVVYQGEAACILDISKRMISVMKPGETSKNVISLSFDIAELIAEKL